MPRTLLIGLAMLLSSLGYAETFDSRFDEGYGFLRAGDPESALEAFQTLLTEDPDSELIQYSIAAALYDKGIKDLQTGTGEEVMASLYEARDAFDALRNSRDPFLRWNAPFGAANSTAQVARHLDPKDQYSERVQALQDAIQAYETLQRQRPEDSVVRTNLNHARYLLKTMMQDPPPEQQDPDDSGGDEGEDGENQEEQEGEQGDEDQEGEEGDQDPEDGEDQEDSENENPGGEPQDSASEGDPLEDQNIEAILQSLEDKNKEEQKNLRKAKGPPKVRGGKWW